MSDSDVESYKQIKADLDVLRQSVEKSELWVYKSKLSDDLPTGKAPSTSKNQDYTEDDNNVSADANKIKYEMIFDPDDEGPPLHPEQYQEYRKIEDILKRMNILCTTVTPGEIIKPRKHEQRLLRNVGVHTIVLDLLQVGLKLILLQKC